MEADHGGRGRGGGGRELRGEREGRGSERGAGGDVGEDSRDTDEPRIWGKPPRGIEGLT